MRRYRWVVVLLITLLLTCIPTRFALAVDNDVLTEVKYILVNHYVDEVPKEVLTATSVEEVLELLGDEHTAYWTQDEFRDFLIFMESSYAGIGISIEAVDEGIRVLSVFEGSPAMSAGIRADDIIINVDGVWLKGKPANEGQRLLMGEEGSQANLIVKRGNSTYRFTVTRNIIEFPTVTGGVIDGDIGYIDIYAFAQNTEEEFRQLVMDMDEKVEGWIIDLQDNGGGYFHTATMLAGYFIENEVVLQIEELGSIKEYTSFKQDFVIDKPVIVLVNRNSASAAEILTAALKDYKKAIIVGEKTYGKGSMQSFFELSNHDYFKVTTARFYSPLMNEINGVGISPDVITKDADSLEVAKLLLHDKLCN